MGYELDNVLLLHPGLEARNIGSKQLLLTGVVKMPDSRWCHLRIACPNFPKITDMQLQIQQGHQTQSFSGESPPICDNWSVGDLLDHLHVLVNVTSEDKTTSPCTVAETTLQMYREIAQLYLPTSYKIHLNADNSLIRFSQFAQQLDERHYLEIELPSRRVAGHSLPDGVPWHEQLQKCPSLTAMVAQFQRYLDELQPFYENFNIIDELCLVVQPTAPDTKHNYRVFVLRDRVYLKLIIADPFAPAASMSLQIIGPTHEVEELRRVYSDGLRSWDPELDIHKNLLRIFDLCFFPMASVTARFGGGGGGDNNASAEDAHQCCNICFCYKLDKGEIPVISCDNQRCSLIFHAVCLKEWFNTLTGGKTFMNVTFGTCPFCKSKLSASFAELLEV